MQIPWWNRQAAETPKLEFVLAKDIERARGGEEARQGGREGGREGGRQGGREGGREGKEAQSHVMQLLLPLSYNKGKHPLNISNVNVIF